MGERIFDDRPATREQVPIMLGLVGPSGSGKTYSALRVATGIQRVVGGDIRYIDTESRRALHYADGFTFRHVPLGAPFSPLDYLAAIEHCVERGSRVIVVDSMSHEHEGPGGLLELHEAEVQRMSGGDLRKAERVKFLAWGKPKRARRRLINTILQLPVSVIFCFRAKEKLKITPGKEPEALGWMAITGDEYIYEMTANCLLLPGSKGVPSWQSDHAGERATMKRPDIFAAILKGEQLDEDAGEALARWAAGSGPVAIDADTLITRYAACSDPSTLRVLEEQRKVAWATLDKAAQKPLKAASDAAAKRIAEAIAENEACLAAAAEEEEPVEPSRCGRCARVVASSDPAPGYDCPMCPGCLEPPAEVA